MSEVIDRAGSDLLPEDREVEELAGALDRAIAAVELLDGAPRAAADALRAGLDDVHRAMLVHVVRSLKADERGRELLFELVDDPRVRMVLLMHGLIRPDPLTAAREALDAVRPQLQSHGGDVSLDRIEDGVAYVRLSGACNGCSMSAVTMRNGVEQALKERVPGVLGVEVLPNEPGPALIMAWGDADQFVAAQRTVGRALPEDTTFTTTGGHTWETFASLWRKVAATTPWQL